MMLIGSSWLCHSWLSSEAGGSTTTCLERLGDMEENMTPAEIKRYLDDAITSWRKIRDESSDAEQTRAVHYIDAYQSVRMTLFGELLPMDVTDEQDDFLSYTSGEVTDEQDGSSG